MSDTPRTDAAECRLRYYETRCGDRYEETLTYIEPEYARDLERELAAVKAERDEAIAWMRVVGEEIAIAGHRSGDRAETLAGLRCLREERDRMRPVVEAAQNFRRPAKTFFTLLDALNDAVDTYEAATCHSATETP